MTLDSYIAKQIIEYPTLFLADTYELSKFIVMHKLCTTSGDWAHTKDPKKGGYIVYARYQKWAGDYRRLLDKPYGAEKYSLDPRFFTGETVYQFELNALPDDVKDFGMSMNITRTRYGREHKVKRIVFESDLDKETETRAELFSRPYDPNAKWVYEDIRKDARIGRYKGALENPYPGFSKGSGPFQNIPMIQEDWRVGCLEHMNYWLTYFKDDQRIKNFDYVYPTPSRINELKEFIEKIYPDPNTRVEKVINDTNYSFGKFKDFNGSNYAELAHYQFNRTRSEYIAYIEDVVDRLTNI